MSDECVPCAGMRSRAPSYSQANPFRRTVWFAVPSMENVTECVVKNDDGACTEFHSSAAVEAYLAEHGLAGLPAMFTVFG